ncbi:MAG: hypothetical protein ACRDOE_18960, partial [Streptosporangiaceae bacterium]
SCAAAACSVDTYAADSPNTSATRFPENPARRTTVTAKFRTSEGVPAGVLTTVTGMNRRRVFHRLLQLAAEGYAVQTVPGYWRTAG